MADPGMKIGELARRCDVNIDTIRYYELQGLLPAPDRLASGYRPHEAQMGVAPLRWTVKAQRRRSMNVESTQVGNLLIHDQQLRWLRRLNTSGRPDDQRQLQWKSTPCSRRRPMSVLESVKNDPA